MANITIKRIESVIDTRLFSAGKELFRDALKKADLQSKKELSPEEAIFVMDLLKESMHTEISKKAIDKCIDEIGLIVSKD
jgi:hypothetical protein